MNRYDAHCRKFLVFEESECDNNISHHFSIRQKILKQTIEAFSSNKDYHKLAHNNLLSWTSNQSNHDLSVIVVPDDWGSATLHFSKKFGSLFTVLNMANPHYPGGGYLQGCVAQEENMFRRTDCHFSIQDNHYDFDRNTYSQSMINLLSAKDNMVYLDHKNPRVCIRNKENKNEKNLGYSWLTDNEVFPFVELRAAAQDCRYKQFDKHEADRRIGSQFYTLLSNNIKYVILGAFGCGAFNNPSEEVATIYKKYIDKFGSNFKAIIFPIYNAGYGPDNYSVFKQIIPTTNS